MTESVTCAHPHRTTVWYYKFCGGGGFVVEVVTPPCLALTGRVQPDVGHAQYR